MKLHILIDAKKILTMDELNATMEPLSRLPFEKEVALLEPKLFPSNHARRGNPLRFSTRHDYLRYLDRNASEGDILLRVRTGGHPIRTEIPLSVIRVHVHSENDYTLADGGRVMLYELSFEAVTLTRDLCRRMGIFPDGTLCLGKEARQGNYLLNKEEMAFYLTQHFRQLYASPRSFMIEVSTQCNFRCKMCFYHAPSGGSGLFRSPSGLLPADRFRLQVDRIHDRFGSFPVLDINGRGEPLLHPDLPELIQYAKMKGFTCTVSTNGSLLSKEMSQALLDAGMDKLAVSLDAADPDAYARIRLGGDYDLVTRNIRQFLELREKHPYRAELLLRIILQPENGHSHLPFVQQWRNDSDCIVASGRYRIGPEGTHTDFSAAPFDGYDACVALWSNAAVTVEGNLYPCCLICSPRAYEDSLGTIEELDSFWTRSKVQEYRARSLENQGDPVPFCEGCGFHYIPATLTRGYEQGMFYKRFYNAISYTRC